MGSLVLAKFYFFSKIIEKFNKNFIILTLYYYITYLTLKGNRMNFCFNCGAELIEEDQRFCIKCGVELKERTEKIDFRGSELNNQAQSNYHDYFNHLNPENESIISNEGSDIKQIRTYTLSDKDVDCRTYEKTLDFLSNKLFNEREGHFHYVNRPIKIEGKTLILFKYKGELIAKGIFSERVEVGEMCEGEFYPGYYQVENGSVEIFNGSIDLDTINRYFPVKSLRRDQIFDKKYFDDIYKMIKDFTKYK